MSISQQNIYQQLSASCVEYIAHNLVGNTLLGSTRVDVEFVGRFAQRNVVWFASIRCLPSDNGMKQYIDIQARDPDAPRVDIGLPLNNIDEPAILKSILMIRQYKNLGEGRHEFSGGSR